MPAFGGGGGAAGLKDPTAFGGDLIYHAADFLLGHSGTATAHNTYQGAAGNVCDGDDSTYWYGNNGAGSPPWVMVDVGTPRAGASTRFLMGVLTQHLSIPVKVQGSNDGVAFTDVVTIPTNATDQVYTATFPAPVSYRYWRLINASTGPLGAPGDLQVFTWQVFGAGVTRLPIGAQGQALESVAGLPAWVTLTAGVALGGPASSSAPGDTEADGAAATSSHSDHRHAREAFGPAPSSSAVGDAAGAGAATTLARADHRHGREGFGAVTAQTTAGAASANGSATSVARSDHAHGTPPAGAGSTTYVRSVSTISTNVDSTSTTFVEIDPSMQVPITVPASGVARVDVSLWIALTSGTIADAFLGVDPGVGTYTQVSAGPLYTNNALMMLASYVFTGLTPGATTFKFGWKTSGGGLRVPGAGRGGTAPGCWMAVTV